MGFLDKLMHHNKEDENTKSSTENNQDQEKQAEETEQKESTKADINRILEEAKKDEEEAVSKKKDKVVWTNPGLENPGDDSEVIDHTDDEDKQNGSQSDKKEPSKTDAPTVDHDDKNDSDNEDEDDSQLEESAKTDADSEPSTKEDEKNEEPTSKEPAADSADDDQQSGKPSAGEKPAPKSSLDSEQSSPDSASMSEGQKAAQASKPRVGYSHPKTADSKENNKKPQSAASAPDSKKATGSDQIQANGGQQKVVKPLEGIDNSDLEKVTITNKKNIAKNPKPIIVSFRYNNKVANDYVFSGKIDQYMQIKDLPIIPGYRLATRKDKFGYKISEKTQHVTLNLIPDNVTYQLIPVNEKMQPIAGEESKTLKGQSGTEILNNEFPVVPGYQPVFARTYSVPEKDGDVKIVYTPTNQTISVTYQTLKGKVLGQETLHGKTGEKYNIRPEEHQYEGYELADVPNSLSGVFTPHSNTTLILKYQPVKSHINVSFLDESGNEIHKPLTYDGAYGMPYSIKVPTIDGYELTSESSLLNGNYDLQPKEIVLRFKRSLMKVRIHFWLDAQHKKSAGDDKVVTGLLNDFYEYEVPELDGYNPKPARVTGRFQKMDNPDVDVVYQRIESVVRLAFQDQAGRKLPVKPMEQKGFWGEDYYFRLPDIEGYHKPMETYKGQFQDRQITKIMHYTADQVTIQINYLNDQTNSEIPNYPAETLTGLMGTAYSIEPKMIDGYRLQELPDNASGIFNIGQRHIVNFMYHPNSSRIILHQLDTAQNVLFDPIVQEGFYGQPYSFKAKDFPGYKFVNASDDLQGTYPVTQKDINLYYRPDTIKFTIMPVDQYDKEIDPQYNVQVSGLIGQQFSSAMPKIPGYTTETVDLSGTIKPDMQDKVLQVKYQPMQESATIHFICEGGSNDQTNPLPDYTLNGLMGDTFSYDAPTVAGYKPEKDVIEGVFTDDEQYITLKYVVQAEHYGIQFIDQHGQLVGGLPEGDGYYGQVINIAEHVPHGFHLPASSDGSLMLNGKGHYLISVIPDVIMTELVAKTEDGKDLGSRHQVSGNYHEEQTFQAPIISGFTPVNGSGVKVKFEVGMTEVPIYYRPEQKKVIVRFISTQGNQLAEPKEYTGSYGDKYSIEAPDINGYSVMGTKLKQGVYGLENIETAFIYRASSDNLNYGQSGQANGFNQPKQSQPQTSQQPQKPGQNQTGQVQNGTRNSHDFIKKAKPAVEPVNEGIVNVPNAEKPAQGKNVLSQIRKDNNQ